MNTSAYMLLMFALIGGLVAGCATTPVQQELADGIKAYRDGDVHAYIQHTKRAHEMDPKDPFVINDMGVVYELEGNKDEALAHYKEAYQRADDRVVRYSHIDEEQGRLLRVLAHENYDNLCKASGKC
jgi:tetratricopeptide (TPR) repeat protein